MELRDQQVIDAYMYLEADVTDALEEELKREPTEEEVEERMNEIQQDPGFDIEDYIQEYQDKGLIY